MGLKRFFLVGDLSFIQGTIAPWCKIPNSLLIVVGVTLLHVTHLYFITFVCAFSLTLALAFLFIFHEIHFLVTGSVALIQVG